MSTTNNFVFKALLIVAWLIFVALSVEAGGLLVNFFFSMFKPESLPHLYQKLDLTETYKKSQMVFFGVYGFILTIAILKACLFYLVTRLMHKMALAKPFSAFVAKQISRISYFTLFIGLLSYLARQITASLLRQGFVTEVINKFWEDSQAFILMGAVIYIIAAIFNKGVAIQNENDLTV
ncbi:MAG: DUF2975 domain-containing protein [Sphingobacteriales bacterium]|nr:DUF2975 domain-containing protein [Sphingobacteriales bacterium]